MSARAPAPRGRRPLALGFGAGEAHLPVRRALERGRTRLLATGALFACAFAVVGLRVADLTLPGIGAGVAEAALTPRPARARAEITDRNGVLLATNLINASLFADPVRVPDVEATARRLNTVLPELSVEELRAKLSAERRFVWLKRNLTPRQQYAVNRLGLPGLDFQYEQRRVYPLGGLTAHVTGFTGIDNSGLGGIEKSFNDLLDGGRAGLALSLDVRLQHILRQELQRSIDYFSASGGAGLVLDANNGEVLAMVSLPDFDPNQPAGDVDDPRRFNRNTLGVYEMGSTFKIFTTAMALDSGTVSLDSGYDASQPIRVSRFTIRDYHAKNRWLSVPEIFKYSSNIGAAKMALDLGTARQRDYLGRFGLLRPATIELPEIGRPMVPNPWREINTMTIAYGHGLAVSPLQLASAVAAVVNGGTLRPPTLLKRAPGTGDAGRRVLSPRTSSQMRDLMGLVVEDGTGRNADVPGYRVGGKTGTSDKAGRGGYASEALLSSFVGAFPIDAPRYVVLAMIDDPKGRPETYGFATGGWVAAPVVGRVVARMAPLLGMAPVAPPAAATDGLLVEARASGADLAAR